MGRAWRYMGIIALFVLFLFVPHLISEYRLNLVISMLIYSLFAVSYNMLLGHAGLLSFGHAAYFGIGGYTTAILFKHLDLPLAFGILAGGAAGGLLGLVLGIFVARMSGVSFALLTLAFNQLIYATAEKWRSVSGGEEGINFTRPNISLPILGEIDMFATANWYYFTLLVVGLCIFACWYFTKTPLGRLNMCMRENEERARVIGYNTYAARVVIYVISTFFAGVAGALVSSFQEFISPTSINLDKAAEVLIMTFIGGSGTFLGPVLGACFITYINDFLSSLTERWAMVQGAIFILLVLYAPKGISGLSILGLKALSSLSSIRRSRQCQTTLF